VQVSCTWLAFSSDCRAVGTKASGFTRDVQQVVTNILIDNLEEIKDKIIGSVLSRVEKLEGKLHDQCIEQTQ